MAQFCTKCGNEVKPNSKFCNKCGKAVEPISLSNSKGQTDNNDKEYSTAEASNGLISKLQNQKTSVQIIVAIVGIVMVCSLFSAIKSIFKGSNDTPLAIMETYGKFCTAVYNNAEGDEKEYYKLFGKDATAGKALLKEINRSRNLLPKQRSDISYAIMKKPVTNGDKVNCGVIFYDKKSGKIYYEHIMALGKQSSGEYLLDSVVLYNGVRDKKAYQDIASVLNANVEKAMASKAEDNKLNKNSPQLYSPSMTNEEIATIVLSGRDPKFKYNYNYTGNVKHSTVDAKLLEANGNSSGYRQGFLSVINDEVVVSTLRTVNTRGYDMGVKTATLLNAKEVMEKFENEYEKHSNSSTYDFYVIYKLLIKNDLKGADAEYGRWDGKDHMLPVRVHASIGKNYWGSNSNAYTMSGESDNLNKYTVWLADGTDWDLVNTITSDMMFLMSKIKNKRYELVDKYSQTNKSSMSTKPSSANTDIKTAKNTFLDYNKAITDKDYKKAYNLLSTERQGFERSYKQFASTYEGTISREVIDMKLSWENASAAEFSYKVKVVYRVDNKAKYYTGFVKLITENGVWRIRSYEDRSI